MANERPKRKRTRFVNVALAVAVASLAPLSGAEAALSAFEARCESRLARAAIKLNRVYLKGSARCRERRAAGEAVTCPDSKVLAAVAALKAALAATADARCGSRCSIAEEVRCLSQLHCPPGKADVCNAATPGKEFDLRRLGYPGPFCDDVLGRDILTGADLGDCVAALVDDASVRLSDALYGGPDGPPPLSDDGVQCLSGLARGAQKLVAATLKVSAACRDKIQRGASLGNPSTCAHTQPKSKLKIEKAATTVTAAASSCSPAAIAELPACGAAEGNTTPAAVADCITTLVRGAVDPLEVPADRAFAAPALLEAIFPPVAVCGDDVVNQGPRPGLPLGEECDGDDDDACPGLCFAAGDLFECTCSDTPRLRLFISAASSEVDSGWTGHAHDQSVADLAGFVTSLENCDCSDMENGECVGTSNDPICDVYARLAPRCSWDFSGALTCDQRGNGNGADEDPDCSICDARSANAGAFCSNDSQCQSRCFDGLTPVGPCTTQDDCAAGLICRGRCDKRHACTRFGNGGPLPVSSGGAAICAQQSFRTDVVGTRNLLTGAHELSYRQFSRIHWPESADRPCPVCGGFCDGGERNLAVCKGRCPSGDECRFDSDCPSGQTCSRESPDCPGGECELGLICGSTQDGVLGRTCRIDYEHPRFGTVSNDCSPDPSKNISGQGLEVDYLPAASSTLTLPATVPCTASGLGLFDCPCSGDAGTPTKPNSCEPACSAPGPFFGQGCADGIGTGEGTECDAGPNVGRLCDEDSDCPGGACAANPMHCTGDPGFERVACATNADCGTGACVDACPGGRCLPLCTPSDTEPGEAFCAAGPVDHLCDGPNQSDAFCSAAAAGATCSATCSQSATACMSDAECPAGEQCLGECPAARDCEAGADGVLGTSDDVAGGGKCVAKPRECFLDPIVAQGGEPGLALYHSAALWCFGATTNPGVNATSGFGGPGRAVLHGIHVGNFESIPP